MLFCVFLVSCLFSFFVFYMRFGSRKHLWKLPQTGTRAEKDWNSRPESNTAQANTSCTKINGRKTVKTTHSNITLRTENAKMKVSPFHGSNKKTYEVFALLAAHANDHAQKHKRPGKEFRWHEKKNARREVWPKGWHEVRFLIGDVKEIRTCPAHGPCRGGRMSPTVHVIINVTSPPPTIKIVVGRTHREGLLCLKISWKPPTYSLTNNEKGKWEINWLPASHGFLLVLQCVPKHVFSYRHQMIAGVILFRPNTSGFKNTNRPLVCLSDLLKSFKLKQLGWEPRWARTCCRWGGRRTADSWREKIQVKLSVGGCGTSKQKENIEQTSQLLTVCVRKTRVPHTHTCMHSSWHSGSIPSEPFAKIPSLACHCVRRRAQSSTVKGTFSSP